MSTARLPLALGVCAAAVLGSAAAAAQDARQVAAYGAFGEGIGAAGVVVSDALGVPEIYVDSWFSYWSGQDGSSWAALRRDPATGGYSTVFVSGFYQERIRRIRVGDVTAHAGLEILVLFEDGQVEVHAQATRERLGGFACGLAAPLAMEVADLDGDGTAEIVVADSASTTVLDGAGNPLAQYAGFGGDDMAVGQMDGDAPLEIALSGGDILDSATGQPQCAWAAGFGDHLVAADIDGDGMDELVFAETWGHAWAFDADLCIPKWSAQMFNPESVQVGDIDNDGVVEVLVGQAQAGGLHVRDAATGAWIRTLFQPEHGATAIAVADVDGDGANEVLWGAGANSTGPDYLYVVDGSSGGLEWQSLDLVGPIAGPARGDVDGDGVDEVVIASRASDSGYDPGMFVVLDQDLGLLAVSPDPYTPSGYVRNGIYDVQVEDLDGNGRAEILLGTATTASGQVEAWEAGPGGFTRTYRNTTIALGTVFHQVRAADVDGDGQIEVIGGGGRTSSSFGTYVHVWDYPGGVEEWRTPFHLGVGDSVIGDLEIADLDDDPALEILALVAGGDVYVFDGGSYATEAIIFGDWSSATIVTGQSGAAHILLGSTTGDLEVYRHVAGSGYAPVAVLPLTGSALVGVHPLADKVLVGSAGRLQLFAPPLSAGPLGRTVGHGMDFGRNLLFLGGREVLSAGINGVFRYAAQ